jgi:hypothetical protein
MQPGGKRAARSQIEFSDRLLGSIKNPGRVKKVCGAPLKEESKARRTN